MAAFSMSMRLVKQILRPSYFRAAHSSSICYLTRGWNGHYQKSPFVKICCVNFSSQPKFIGRSKSISSEKRIQYQVFARHESTSSESGQEQSESKSKKEKKKFYKTTWFWSTVMVSLWGACAVVYVFPWFFPQMDAEGNPIPDEFDHLPRGTQHIKRFMSNFNETLRTIEEPSRPKLLPDPVEYPYIQPPYTLVMEMTGVLVHPDWSYSTGWRFKKRPGVDYFLQQVAPPHFEVVIYTSETGLTADPLLTSLDPNNYITYRLYRDATHYKNNHHIKDLSCLNRDLSKVIFIDWNEKSYSLNTRNGFKLKKWKGEDGDKTLFDLASFLRAIEQTGVEDVREVLDYYSQFDDPIEAFKENQRKLQEEQERQAKVLQESDQKRKSFGFFGRR